MSTPKVNRERVLDAAMRIVEEQGLEALTMRRLASDLGVAVTAIYWHAGNRESLIAELADRVIGQLGDVSPAGDEPGQRIVAIGRSLRRAIHQRPHVIALVYEHGRTAAMMLPAERALAREVGAAGLPAAEAATIVRAVLHHVVGFVLLERAVQRGPEQHPTPTELWREARGPGIDPALARELGSPVDTERLFEVSLGALVDGLLKGR